MSLLDVNANPLYKCKHCFREFKQHQKLNEHLITKHLFNDVMNTNSEIADLNIPKTLPSYVEIVYMLQSQQRQINQMQITIDKLSYLNIKKKINIIDWLNINIIPNIPFNEWCKQISIYSSDYEYLINNSLIDTLGVIIKREIKLSNTNIYPIFCVSQKNNIFYVWNEQTNECNWEKNEPIELLLKEIQHKLLQQLSIWISNNPIMNMNDMELNNYNDSLIKMMDMLDMNKQTKFKHLLFNYLKKDLKTIIEYEFE